MNEEKLDANSLSGNTSDHDSLFSMTADKASALFKEMHEENVVFNEALTALLDGDATVELKKKFVLKAINEAWVKVIEDSIIALDDRIRNYGRHLEESEEVLPIELSRNITSRSLRHLAQHTEYIQKIEGDMIMPSKILNVFRDETIMTYENKFINTLINRLYIFVRKRYMVAKKQGIDEKSTVFKFTTDFEHEDIKGKINLGIEIAETLGGENQSQYVYSTKLWERVEKLYNIVEAYAFSDFAESMGKSYIRPPVMRTNAILKNKNLKQCLVLWEFIESYRDIGYGMLIQENSETVNEEYLRDIYSFSALQYVLFRHNIKNEFSAENTLESQTTDVPISPQFISDVKKIEESEFNVFDTTYMKMLPVSKLKNRGHLSDSEKEIMLAIDTILAALPEWEEKLAAKEEAERIAKEEAERIAKEEAERIAKEEAERIAKEEAERIAKEEAERIAKEEAERIAKEEAKREAKRLAERLAVQEAVQEAIREAERLAAFISKDEMESKTERNGEEKDTEIKSFDEKSISTLPRKRKKKLKARLAAQKKEDMLEIEQELLKAAENESQMREKELQFIYEEEGRRQAEIDATQLELQKQAQEIYKQSLKPLSNKKTEKKRKAAKWRSRDKKRK